MKSSSKQLPTDCKCRCAHCGEVIEYRSTRAGEIVQCAKCGEKSELPVPDELTMLEFFGPPAPEFKNCEACGRQMKFWDSVCPACEMERREKLFRKRIAIGVSLFPVFVVVFLLTRHSTSQPSPARTDAVRSDAGHSDTARPDAGRIFLAQPQSRLPKSTHDLQPANFTLSRRHGETSAVAVGDIRNDSVNLHHHIRADVDLLDKTGAKIGTLSDYFVDLGANETWHFLVPVTDTNVMSIRFAGFKEDE